jgi:cytoskeletal protein CcmA (bactofilin family)
LAHQVLDPLPYQFIRRKALLKMWGKTLERDSRPVLTPDAGSPSLPERTTTAAAAPVAPPARTAATVGKSTRVRGEIYSDEELFMDGEIDGSLEVRNRLTIGPNGKVKANVKAKELVVRGSIQGNVEAEDRIAIMNGASIVGDVKTAGIVIEDGAYFKGGIDILRPETKKPEMASNRAAGVAKTQTAGS